jgi:hypothetical protein
MPKMFKIDKRIKYEDRQLVLDCYSLLHNKYGDNVWSKSQFKEGYKIHPKFKTIFKYFLNVYKTIYSYDTSRIKIFKNQSVRMLVFKCCEEIVNGAYKLKDDLSLDEISSWEQFTLNFPDGSGSVVLYKNPSSLSNVKFTDSTQEKKDTLISGENRSKVCREKIKDFADSANKKLKLPMSQINADKTFVMACRDQFGMKYNDLGVTKKNLEYLTGQRDGLDGYKLKVGSPYRL